MAATPAPTAPAPTPSQLQPLSPGQINKQATSTISQAYAPAYTSIQQQTKQATAISAKRAQDNNYYKAWLDTQMATIQQHADAAHSQLLGVENQLGAQQNALYSGQAGTLIGDANARAGNVSNNAPSNSFGAQLAQSQTSNMGLLSNARLQSAQGIDTANQQLAGARANNYGLISAARTKQQSDLQTVLTGLGNQRTKLDLSKKGDISKEIARLQGVEIQKAQANRNFDLASTKLGNAAANTASLIATRAGNLTVAQQNAMTKDKQFQLNFQKYGDAVAKDLYQRQRGLGPYKPAAGTKVKPPLSQASQNAIYNRISTIAAQIRQVEVGYGLNADQAYHTIRSGIFTAGPLAGKRVANWTKPDLILLAAAWNTREGGKGLSPGDISSLKTLGLTNPGSRLRIPKPVGGGITGSGGKVVL